DVDFEIAAPDVGPESTLISAENLRIIRSAINELPPRCRLIFHLVKEDGLKYRETADLLNISIKTVETQMSLALSKIGTALQAGLSFSDRRYPASRSGK
ncbi:MAG: sigma-70 family RNA polymerase sigma factor, partial [Bacteroidetes bacterium]|nr:sigma-70 family RNA polymerase sigma factor [Bacteroidota bacterium]